MDVTPDHIVVAAAVIERNGAYLLTRRLAGTHLAGCWEFPGGKLQPGETLEACLAREIDEELACTARIGRLIVSSTHEYPELTVALHFFECDIDSVPTPRDGQEMRWVERHALRDLELPLADRVLVEMLSPGDRSA